jgi:Sensors of blue-light using FAD
MIQITYVSRATEPMKAEQLLALLQQCLTNNAVNGVMFYGNETFLQAIEGDADVVDRLLESIRRDLRHKELQVLRRRPIEQREYQNWGMGFMRVSTDELRQVPGLGDFGKGDFNLMYLVQHQTIAQNLLQHYRDFGADPLKRELDAKDQLIERQRQALTRARGYVEVASLMLESVTEASRKGSLTESHLRLCEAALDSLRQI